MSNIVNLERWQLLLIDRIRLPDELEIGLLRPGFVLRLVYHFVTVGTVHTINENFILNIITLSTYLILLLSFEHGPLVMENKTIFMFWLGILINIKLTLYQLFYLKGFAIVTRQHVF